MARQAVACLREALAGGGGGVARTWARSCRPHGRGQGSGRRLGWEERRPHLPHGEEGHLRVRRRTRDLHLWGGRRRAAGFLHLWGVDLSRLDVGQRPSVQRPRTFDDVEAPGAVDVGLRPGLFLPRRGVYKTRERRERSKLATTTRRMVDSNAMPCRVAPCRIMPCRVVSCAAACRVMPCGVVSRPDVSYQTVMGGQTVMG